MRHFQKSVRNKSSYSKYYMYKDYSLSTNNCTLKKLFTIQLTHVSVIFHDVKKKKVNMELCLDKSELSSMFKNLTGWIDDHFASHCGSNSSLVLLA